MVVMAVAVPSRTDAQRFAALEQANEVRVYRAGLKREIKAGRSERSPMDVIAEPWPVEETWRVFELVMALPRVGRVKVNRLLARERISPSKTVVGLSDRQRLALLRALWSLPSVRRGMVRS